MYALDIHFNALFLVYCGALGAPFYALIALAPELHAARDWFDERVPRRFAGGFVMACACAFGALWLSQIVPAILRGTAPVDVDTEGLMTNPVHVLDLALVLPAMFAGGWLLWHRRPLGYALVPVLLGFAVLMGVALAGMAVALALGGLAESGPLVIGFAVFAVVAGVALAWMLHAMERGPGAQVAAANL